VGRDHRPSGGRTDEAWGRGPFGSVQPRRSASGHRLGGQYRGCGTYRRAKADPRLSFNAKAREKDHLGLRSGPIFFDLSARMTEVARSAIRRVVAAGAIAALLRPISKYLLKLLYSSRWRRVTVPANGSYPAVCFDGFLVRGAEILSCRVIPISGVSDHAPVKIILD
jgi:hypothetical protein